MSNRGGIPKALMRTARALAPMPSLRTVRRRSLWRAGSLAIASTTQLPNWLNTDGESVIRSGARAMICCPSSLLEFAQHKIFRLCRHFPFSFVPGAVLQVNLDRRSILLNNELRGWHGDCWRRQQTELWPHKPMEAKR